MTVYLIHFSRPVSHARHYIGYTPDATAVRRVQQHKDGKGSPLVKAAINLGIEIKYISWPGAGRDFERWLKDLKATPRWCPLCGGGGKVPTPDSITQEFRDKPRRYENG